MLKVLRESGKFNITALARKTSSTTVPADVKLIKADYSSHTELVEAFRGQDAVIITVGDDGTIEQISRTLLSAAVEAGVKRIIPSEFGGCV